MNKKRPWEHRIPTIPAIILVVVSLYFTLGLLKNNVFTHTNATADNQPSNITIGNISSTSFAVGFTTNAKTDAEISVNLPGGQEKLIFDDRVVKNPGSFLAYGHIFTVTNLQPNTQYTFTLLVNGTTYKNSGQLFSVTTGSQLSTANTSSVLKGVVMNPDNSKADDTLMILKSSGASTLIGLTDGSGNYSLPLNQLRTSKLDQYLPITQNLQLVLEAFRTNTSSTITLTSSENGEVPPITLSENYAFNQTSPVSTSSSTSEFNVPTPATAGKGRVAISSPQANQSFTDQQPVFRGTALPHQKVMITIHSSPLVAEVLTDSNGNWSFRPNSPLGPGQHSITIQSLNSSGIQQTVTASFTIFPSGTQVAESATPSATPTLEPTSTPTATPTQTPTQAVMPTQTVTSAPTPTLAPTATPTPTQPIATSTSAPVITITPSEAGSGAAIVITLFSVVCIIAGTTLLFIVA